MITIKPTKMKPFQYPVIRVVNPGKGLNTLVSNELIDDHEASDLNNIVFTEAGTITKGPGIKTWGSGLGHTPRGLGSFQPAGGTAQVLAVDNGILKSTSASTDSWTTITGASLTANVPITFTAARTNPNSSTGKDVLYVWDGTTGGCYYDGTNLTRPGTMPSASFSIFFNGAHIAAGTSTNTSRLYLADLNAGTATGASLAYVAGTESWYTFTSPSFNATLTGKTPPANDNPVDVPGATVAGASGSLPAIIDVNPGDGDKITALAKFQGSVIVFKTRSIYQLTFTAQGPVITLINTYLGAVSHRSVDNVENDVFYLTRLGWFTLGYQEGFYTLIRTNELSVRIHPLVATISAANLSTVASIYQPYRFYASIPTGGTTYNNLTVVYDKRYDAWSKLDYINANDFTVYVDSNNNQHLLYSDSNQSQVWEIDDTITTINGAAQTSYFQTKAFNAGTPEVTKYWIDLTLLLRQLSGTLTVTVYTDGGTLAHTSTIVGGGGFNGGIAATGFIGSELYGGNSTNNTVGDPTPSNTSQTPTVAANEPYRINLTLQSRTFMVKVMENTTGNMALVGWAIAYRPFSHFVFSSSNIIQ